MSAEVLAQLFHEHYERLAPSHGYSTREASLTRAPPGPVDVASLRSAAQPWADVPMQNKALMIATAEAVILASLIPETAPGGISFNGIFVEIVNERNELRKKRDELQARMTEMHNERAEMRHAQKKLMDKFGIWMAGECPLGELQAAAQALFPLKEKTITVGSDCSAPKQP